MIMETIDILIGHIFCSIYEKLCSLIYGLLETPECFAGDEDFGDPSSLYLSNIFSMFIWGGS